MSASLRVHDAVLRDAFESRRGYVFTTAGDSFAVAFARMPSLRHRPPRPRWELRSGPARFWGCGWDCIWVRQKNATGTISVR